MNKTMCVEHRVSYFFNESEFDNEEGALCYKLACDIDEYLHGDEGRLGLITDKFEYMNDARLIKLLGYEAVKNMLMKKGFISDE